MYLGGTISVNCLIWGYASSKRLRTPVLEQKVVCKIIPGKLVLSVCVSLQILRFYLVEWFGIPFFYVLKCHVTLCLKRVGARGGVERENESESIRSWKCL